jgi:hypothetical protein
MTDLQNLARLPKFADRLVKYTASNYRKKGISHEDFVRYVSILRMNTPQRLRPFSRLKPGFVTYSLASTCANYHDKVTFIGMRRDPIHQNSPHECRLRDLAEQSAPMMGDGWR